MNELSKQYLTIELTPEQMTALEPLFAKLDEDHRLFPGSIVAQVYEDHIRAWHIDHPTGLALLDALSTHKADPDELQRQIAYARERIATAQAFREIAA